MVRKLITYPEPLSLEYGVNVRTFDEKLFALIEDIKDTMNANNLDGLSAYQIGEYLNVMVMRLDNGDELELINPKIITHSGTQYTQETTTYFGKLSAQVKRYESVSVVYQDRNGKRETCKLEGKSAVVVQRKLDYMYGATFLTRMDAQEKKRFEELLDGGIDIGYENYCPRSFFKDKIIKFSNIVVALLFVSFILSFFIEDKKMLSNMWNYQLYSALFVVFLDIMYVVYGTYEGKKYKGCRSCQLGNMIGTSTINLVKLSIIMGLTYVFHH